MDVPSQKQIRQMNRDIVFGFIKHAMPHWDNRLDLVWLESLSMYYDLDSAHDRWDLTNSSQSFGRSKATQREIICKDSEYQIAYLSNIARGSVHIWTFKIQKLNTFIGSSIISIGLFECDEIGDIDLSYHVFKAFDCTQDCTVSIKLDYNRSNVSFKIDKGVFMQFYQLEEHKCKTNHIPAIIAFGSWKCEILWYQKRSMPRTI